MVVAMREARLRREESQKNINIIKYI
jgi:hypothetical protein